MSRMVAEAPNGADAVPVYQEYMNSILDALRASGAPLAIEELDRRVIAFMALPPAVASIPHDPERPDRTEVAYRIAWARSYLKKAGLLDNPSRGKWTLTDRGRAAGTIDAHAVAAAVIQEARSASAGGDRQMPSFDAETEDGSLDEERFAARIGGELETQLRAVHKQLAVDGELLAPAEASRCYGRFRELFGPEALANLDGEALLAKVHARGTRDSLVYWLEFKDDAEFPARFGSIAGGNALKFGIYQAAESRLWFTGTGPAQVQLSVEDAVTLVRKQRDQLIGGVRVLESASREATIDYGGVQVALTQAAPDLAETAWGHKYFALLFPDVIEPCHGVDYQAHQLYKLLKVPGRGRYENARIFAGVAQQLSMSLLDLATVLHRRNGGPYRYWRVGTTVDGASEWERMRRGGFASVGWAGVGDLSKLTRDAASKQALRERMAVKHSGAEAAIVTRWTNQLFQFVTAAAERDLVVAMEGSRVRGVGRVVGDYFFQPDDGPSPHRRAVEWLREGEWRLPEAEALQTTFVPLRKPPNLVEIETRLLGTPSASVRPVGGVPPTGGALPPAPPAPVLVPLAGVVGRINAILQRKRQVILYGPPGTGKTFWAERAVAEMAARGWFGSDAAGLDAVRRKELQAGGAIELCSFHPAYGYEDFLEGFRPVKSVDGLAFELRDGVFKRLCARAAASPKKPFYLIIDEINRGDIPRIFGELLTVLEREKRGRTITLPVSGETFSVPDNVFVVGTMNTTDRSIALLDAALRRRFGFIELVPDAAPLAGASVGGLPLGAWLEELNRRIVKHVGRDARHLQVGHSYLLPGGAPVRDVARFAEILRDDIVPLLEEYCYEDFSVLERILGSRLIPAAKKRVDASLFEPERHADLIQSLLSSFDQITTTHQAVLAEAGSPDTNPEEETEDLAAP